MTCIVGILDKEANNVVIGGDSAATAGTSIAIRKDKKVFRKGDFVIGCTSSYRMIQLLMFSLQLPDVSKDIFEYMCTDFVDAVRKCFNDGGYMKKRTLGDEQGGTFLVAYKDRLFKICDDFQVCENLNGIDAIGCGDDFALGALMILDKQDISSEQKALEALEAAAFFSSAVSGPFVIIRND